MMKSKIPRISIMATLNGLCIALFLNGIIFPVPDDFPYSRGVWNVIGISVILFISFAIIALGAIIKKRGNH